MADSRAFVKKIDPVGSGTNEHNSIHQTSPGWVLTFVRWNVRDTFRTKTNNTTTSPLSVRDPLVVENDCVSVAVTNAKGTLTPQMNATLIMTDVNYETEVAPGDFVFVNMLNWTTGNKVFRGSRQVADAARARQAINGVNDGFKGLFKVQSVQRVLMTDANTGTRMVAFKINGYGFTEFNNTIYFNPYLLDPQQDPKNQLLFASFFGEFWTSMVNDKGITDVQNILAVLIQSLIGTGIAEGQQKLYKKNAVATHNTHFLVPELVGKLLGLNGAKAAKDLYNYIFGIQNYAGGSSATDLAVGMNPEGLQEKYNRFFYTQIPCQGSSLLKPEYWNQVKTWSILNQYTNAPLNELFTCFRVSPNGSVMPTVVFRQIPFTTEGFADQFYGPVPPPVTKFLNLPRWKINPALILEMNIGREEAARVNFVQYFGRSTLGQDGTDIAAEIAAGNYVYDVDDVSRSGLRPYIVTTQFDDPTSQNKDYRSPFWAKILGDALIGGHLKLNGSFQCAGIQDPVAVGDNWEFDGVVYHIEQVNHVASISPQDGKKIFRSTIVVSSGVSTSSSVNGVRYPEMEDTVAYRKRDRDFKNNQILPGVSEEQDVVYRKNVWPTDKDSKKQNAPYAQPNTKTGSQTDNGDDT